VLSRLTTNTLTPTFSLRETGKRSALLLLLFLLAACSSPPSGSTALAIPSRLYVFADQPLLGHPGRPSAAEGHLLLPAGTGPFPAVVILHGAGGPGPQDRQYAELLAAEGYAALTVDSFGTRGVAKTVDDQLLVSDLTMMADAYAALELLAADPRIDADRIGLLGFSKGGTVALYAANERLAAALSPGGRRFAAHAAYYPWCGLHLYRPRTTGRPILLQIGSADEITRASLCEALAAELAAEDPGVALELVVYPGADHAFDHPLLNGAFELSLPVRRAIPNRCQFDEIEPGRFVVRATGEAVTSETLPQLFRACSSDRGRIAGDSAAAAAAEARLLAFFAAALR